MSSDRIMIGDRLNHLLEINGMDPKRLDISKEDLLSEHGFNKSSLQKYLTNVRRPNLEDIVALSNLFNTNVDYLVGNKEYILDTFDPEYLKEFFTFASEEMTIHFRDRHNVELSNNDSTYPMLFALIHYLVSPDKTLEDYSTEEAQFHKDIIEHIIAIFYGTLRMAKFPNFHIDELKGILSGISDYLDEEYSFKDAAIINSLEKREDKTAEEKIEILKSYIHVNMTNGRKALELLQELSERK
ncbi:helix-turn-helix domain-containing protein [Rummeliibacillus stabekisii]|uniref:HTH cro/C1-type domain-containing protein n=1 Tax=Rummeliibacillus stabekisii TaxID=241244 RepID=A0A143HF44_9BACL|nr:helix-turn-helix transcriptional regulator [Rummeliibacillus stabekisii]AMX00353.1 hypothetical protein ATY39_13595 [Rummeliibacillus stabekisii]